VTTRKVADLIEYSQPTIYEYFENKEAICWHCCTTAMSKLYTMTQAAYSSTR